MRKLYAILGVIMVTALVLSACATPTAAPTEAPVVEPTEAPVATEAPVETEEASIPLVVAYADFSQKFSPFYSDSAYDADVAGMTQISLLKIERASCRESV
mgnify:CR=1 FL=1